MTQQVPSLPARLAVLAFGTTVYALFLAVFLTLIAFIEGVFLPVTVDSGAYETTLSHALWIDGLLLGLFGVQHTIMARRRFKQWMHRLVPAAVERSIFVLATCAVLSLVVTQWHSVPGMVWSIESTWLSTVMHAIGWLGWGVVLYATFLIDHFHLFGLRQVVEYFRGRPLSNPRFLLRSLYRHIRHPLYLGFLMAFWCTPEMSWGRFVFGTLISCYLVIGIRVEERSLVQEHGDDYREYRKQVSMLLPMRAMLQR